MSCTSLATCAVRSLAAYTLVFSKAWPLRFAALLVLAVVACRDGLSAMIFAVHRSTFSGEHFAITAKDIMPTTNSLQM
jgi:hypothetical protein